MWCVQLVSLLLRHGADTCLCNSLQQRPIDVADDDEVIELLSRHTHQLDDVKPTVTDNDLPLTVSCTDPDRLTGYTIRRHLSATDDEADIDVVEKASCVDQGDDVPTCDDLFEPLDLSIHKGADDLI